MTPNPKQVGQMVGIRVQSARINAKLDRVAQARANGYKGPLTRADLAKAAERRANGHV